VRVLHGGFEEWEERGFPTQPKGSEWQVESEPTPVPEPVFQETVPAPNPLDATGDAGL